MSELQAKACVIGVGGDWNPQVIVTCDDGVQRSAGAQVADVYEKG